MEKEIFQGCNRSRGRQRRRRSKISVIGLS